MKKLLIVAIVLLIAVLMAMTVPDKQEHKEAMMKAVTEFVEEEAAEKYGDNVLTNIGKGVVLKTVEVALNSKLREGRHVLWNTTYVRLKGEDQLLSVGLLGHVFTFDKEMLREALEDPGSVEDAEEE